MSFLRDLLTEADNETQDIIRWAGALGCLEGLVLAAWDVIVHHAHFDFQAYGIGIGAMLTGVGLALGFKAKENKPS